MFKSLLAAFRYVRLLREYAPKGGKWEARNATDTAVFFNTDTGKLLKSRLDKYVYTSAIKATQQAGNRDFHCGVAHGAAMTVGIIQDHYLEALNKQEEPETETVMPLNASSLASLLSP